ncbi:hypothetical protein [Longimicrobium sp.]|uniref:hypothetical protein n=1 Tax=Longimicrobium sp. TaxID=2029185 RepID=UPI002E33194E|nr:hypothetical protein [Longimicrobium sp.]HEX6040776.1 hypothetical protein [Longimicrobium sp.]
MRLVLPLLVLACVGACDATPDADATEPAGRLVESRAPRWTQADAWRLDPQPALTIGEADGEAAEYALDGVVGAARLSDGRIVIATRKTFDLRYYDARGHHLRSTGSKGDGPGEFRVILGIGRDRDTILVWDPFASRVSRFDPSGAFAGSTSISGAEMRFLNFAGFLNDGSVLLRPLQEAKTDEFREGEYVDSAKYLRFSTRTGAQLSAPGPYFGSESFKAVVNRFYMSNVVIFGRQSFVATADSAFYRAESDRFQATFHRPDGSPVRTARRPYTPTRASSADVAAQLETLAADDEELMQMSPQTAAAQRRLAENIPHRSTLPAITQLRVDREDNLWIRAYVPPGAEAAEWSVFDPEGHWLGIVRVPANLEVLEIGDDYVLARTVDPLDDVERVVLHRLHKPR